MRVFLTALTFSAGIAHAEPPRVLTDIAPVNAIARAVMNGIGEPDVLLPLTASPHHYSMRPSDAAKVSGADIVLWVGPKLSPWLEESLTTLAPNAERIALMEVKGTKHLELREAGEAFESHDDHEGHGDHKDHDEHAGHDDHGHEDHDHDDHGHDDHGHDDHGHDDHAHDDHEGHGHEGHDHDSHAHDDHHHHHEGEDPHVWLSPENAKLWATEIAEHLGEHDPENAAQYAQNAERFVAEVVAAQASIRATLKPVQKSEFIVFHDAFGYFEDAFDTRAHAVLHVNDEAAPGPKRVAKMRALVAEEGITCAFYDPGHGAIMIGAFEDTGLQPVALHPMGLEGQTYPQILTSLATTMADCLK